MAHDPLLLALDQGTSSSRAMLFGPDAEPRSVAQRATLSTYPRPGWVNQDAAEIWGTTLDTARACLAESGSSAKTVTAVGIANQRETTILWDRATGHPAAPAIVWQSRQSAPLVDAIDQRGMAATYAVAPPVDTRARATLLQPDILPSFTPEQMVELGAGLDEGARAHGGLLALVEVQNGSAAPSYVAGTQNFYAITRYNQSSYYALAVIALGEAVRTRR